MTPADFQKFFPLVDDWMWAALAAYAGTARPVASCGFPRLPLYFTAETLASAKVVIMEAIMDNCAPADLTVTGLAQPLAYSWTEQERRIRQ